MIYIKLFWSFFQIGLCSIGGGYAAMPLIQNQIVEINNWLTMTEFIDLITISQMTPGPIAINSATFVGMRIAGAAGALIATIGVVLPSSIIVLILSFFYYRYKEFTIIQSILDSLRPAIVAFIASAGLTILTLAFCGQVGAPLSFYGVNFFAVALFILSFALLRKYKLNPILVMFGCGVMGVAFNLLT